MKIQIKSDMHHEFSRRYSSGIHEAYIADKAIYNPRYINPEAEVLVLAGDIIVANSEQINELKQWTTSLSIPVVYVTGNHEYYHSSISDVNQRLIEAFKDTNVKFLNNDWFTINDTIFVGGTLWTKLSHPFAIMVRNQWGDFRYIKDFKVNHWQQIHQECVHKISEVLNFPNFKNMKKVVVTHHLPSDKSTPVQYKNDEYNVFFNTNLENLIKNYKPNLWIHGHTHNSFDYKIEGTRVVCNPYGYFPQDINPEYKRDLIVEI
jgi:predicted phosphohydrolase